MDPRFSRLKKAVSSRPFLMFIFFIAVLIVLTAIYVGLRDDGMAGTDVYWYVAVALVAVIAIIFLLCAFICPSYMTPARAAPDQPVSYHGNPERVSIGRDNYGANIQPELQSVESSTPTIIQNPFRRIFGSANYSPRNERSLPAPPGPDDWRTRNLQMRSPMWDTPPPTYREAVNRAVVMGSELASQSRNRDLTFSLATTPSEPESDRPHLAQSTPLPPDTTDAVNDQRNVALNEPSPPSSGAENDAQASPEAENELNLNRAASSSSSTHTGSSTTTDSYSTWTSVSSLTVVSSEDSPSGPDENAPRDIASDLPSCTEQSGVKRITLMQRIAAEGLSGLSLVHQSTRTPISLQRRRGSGPHPGDALSDHGSIGNVESSVNETPVPAEEGSKMATPDASPVSEEGKELASHADVSIDMEDDDDDVETELGLVLQLASSLLGAAWSSVSRWVRPQQELPSSVPTEASPESPLSVERRIVASPGSGNEEPSPEVTASTPTRVNITECTEPSQQGEDVVPPKRRERP